MTAEERNFRSSYYEKVGCHSVEEKKSLNKLLQDNIRNHAKLKQFCLNYTVLYKERGVLWNIILGVLPLHKNSTEYIMEQRVAVYKDLLRAVQVMKGIESTNWPTSKVMQAMWQLEGNRLLHPSAGGFTTEDDDNFLLIVEVLLQIFENDVETYWIAKEFFKCTKNVQKECSRLKEMTQTLLKREDVLLHNHLEKLDIFAGANLLDKWYGTCFAGVINELALVKIWDKICGGSVKIVVFVFLEMIKAVRENVLKCNTQKELKTLIEQIKDQDAVIVNKGIKSWQSSINS